MKIRNFILISFIFFCSSCQQLSKWLVITPNEEFQGLVKTGQHCSDNTKFELIGSNPLANKQFVNEIVKEDSKVNFYTLATELSLFQMDIRPEQSGPYSRFQFIIYDGKNFIYKDFHRKRNSNPKDTTPFIDGLRWLASQSPSKNLTRVAKELDKKIPNYIFVGPVFASWLSQNKDQFLDNELFREHFFKGDQVVVYGESIQSLNHEKIAKTFTNSKEKAVVFEELPFKSDKSAANETVSCNFDQKLYKEMILSKEDPKSINANVFGFKMKNGATFIGITMINNPSVSELSDQFLLQAEHSLRPVPVCIYSSKNNQMVFMANAGIDPAQHVTQLLELSLDNVKDLPELEQRMAQARTLFLVKPARMAVETKLITQDQLSQLHHYQLPIYHSDRLAEIWSWFKSKNDIGFLADPRYERGLVCHN